LESNFAVVARRGCAARIRHDGRRGARRAQPHVEAHRVRQLTGRGDVGAGHRGRQAQRGEDARGVGRVVRAVRGIAVAADDARADQPLAAAEILAPAHADQVGLLQPLERRAAERRQQRRRRVRVARRDLDEARA
jgi:hypothetical protein